MKININAEIMRTINFHFKMLEQHKAKTKNKKNEKKFTFTLVSVQMRFGPFHLERHDRCIYKSLKLAKRGERLFNLFYYFDSTILAIHWISSETSTLGHYSKYNFFLRK